MEQVGSDFQVKRFFCCIDTYSVCPDGLRTRLDLEVRVALVALVDHHSLVLEDRVALDVLLGQ